MDRIDTPGRFGALVRAQRRALGLTQRDVALAVDVGERFIVDLENGKPTCQLGKALAVARSLGIRLTDAADSAPSAPDVPEPRVES
jgi:HTH-type transcriptional regulator / antitoxin HipB